uniref:Histone-lysine N-methyltransferase ATXR2 n=1 Tax=Nicotiana tabacum TaxID=4097 RepID=A0A1S3X964_TOBAC|nr:PREDICTED: histone-lysine N-methyltransferase ATXR2-like [Nicotiana tabacum]
MEIICPIDKQFSDQIAAFLKPPPPHEVQKYFEELLATRQCRRLKVKPTAYHGKGVYAETDFKESDLVLKDQMLAGAQHSSNKVDCLVCSYCFCFIGSIELQIGRKLYLAQLGVSRNRFSQMNTSRCCIVSGCIHMLFKMIDSFSVLSFSSSFFRSKSCAEADWESFHSLLCTGEGSKSLSTKALLKFMEHANDTNDIFLLAAKVISFTILRHRKLKESRHEGKGKQDISESRDFSLLLEAWKPVSVGYKRRWWDCIALPDDVDGSDEASFRMQIKELAFTSLQLLKAAIFDEECKPLLSLEMYGHIIGMFELNNLDLVVESPVEDYFLYIDDLPLPGKEEAEQTTKPILDALGDDYSICCQGTAFFPLQSCMNHSCRPNAKAFKREEDRDGQATIIALQPIAKGEEITISYIDEDLPFEERQALLADYGFRCRCSKCLEEA